MTGLQPGSEPGHLMVPSCQSCGRAHWYPKPACPWCGGEWRWASVDGRGTIFTYSVVHRPFSPELADRLPLAVGSIALDVEPSVRLVTNFVDCPSDELRVGMAAVPEVSGGTDEDRRINYRPMPSRE